MIKECEIKTGTVWHAVSVEEALSFGAEDMRCIECHGRVCAHKEYINGVAAHFEHIRAHPGCSQIPTSFSGVKSRHPEAIK
jgi:hypothetical protein